MALTGETPFENLLIDTLNAIQNKQEDLDKNQKELCVRQSVLETKWEGAVDQKIKSNNKKYKLSTIFLSIAMVVSTAWQAYHTR